MERLKLTSMALLSHFENVNEDTKIVHLALTRLLLFGFCDRHILKIKWDFMLDKTIFVTNQKHTQIQSAIKMLHVEKYKIFKTKHSIIFWKFFSSLSKEEW